MIRHKVEAILESSYVSLCQKKTVSNYISKDTDIDTKHILLYYGRSNYCVYCVWANMSRV